MTNATGINVNHIVIYFDRDLSKQDGHGWCVESSDSEMTVRFGTIAGALAYASTEEQWLRGA
jgi:hypothetical protein